MSGYKHLSQLDMDCRFHDSRCLSRSRKAGSSSIVQCSLKSCWLQEGSCRELTHSCKHTLGNLPGTNQCDSRIRKAGRVLSLLFLAAHRNDVMIQPKYKGCYQNSFQSALWLPVLKYFPHNAELGSVVESEAWSAAPDVHREYLCITAMAVITSMCRLDLYTRKSWFFSHPSGLSGFLEERKVVKVCQVLGMQCHVLLTGTVNTISEKKYDLLCRRLATRSSINKARQLFSGKLHSDPFKVRTQVPY